MVEVNKHINLLRSPSILAISKLTPARLFVTAGGGGEEESNAMLYAEPPQPLPKTLVILPAMTYDDEL